jgi:MYXO-CTERM domain-containing protein
MKRTRGRGAWVLVVLVSVWVAPVSGWAGPPKKAPDEAQLREVAELTAEYERLFAEGVYGEATALAERVCAILGDEHGTESAEAARCLNDLAFLNNAQGARDQAKRRYRQALRIWKRVESTNHPFFVQLLVNLGCVYHDERAYGRAKSLYKQALAISESALGSDPQSLMLSLNNLAALYHDQRAYEDAMPLYERALAVAEKSFGADDPRVAVSINNLAGILDDQGAYDRAEPLYERALEIREKAFGSTDATVAKSLNNLAGFYWERGEYGRAQPLYERALTIREQTLSPNHLDVAMTLDHLAGLYCDQGAYTKAEPLYRRALAIREKALGPDDLVVATSLNGLALLYDDQGAYGKAEPLYRRALAIREKALGPDDPLVATCLNNLASLYHQQGSYERAETLHRRALAIRERVLPPDHSVAVSLGHLATLHREQGAYERAEPLYVRALEISKKMLGPAHPQVGSLLNNLALLYHDQGAHEKAEPLYRQALAISREVLGPDHPQIAAGLNNLAKLRHEQGAYEDARTLYVRALTVYEGVFGQEHPQVASILENFAVLYEDQGDHDQAVGFYRRSLDITEASLGRTLTVADESRRLAYAATLSGSLHHMLSLHLRAAPTHDGIADLALTALLRRKNRVQELVTQSTGALRRSLPEGDRHLLDDLSGVDSRIAVLSNRERDEITTDAFARQVDELQQQRDQLWSKLAKHSAAVDALDYPVTIEDVQQTLSVGRVGGVLIEFAHYAPQHDDTGVRVRKHGLQPPPRYAAYLVFPDRFDWVDLGPAAPIDEHIKVFRKAFQTKQAIPTDLYDAVMRPIVEKLGSTHRLILAPAGTLSLVPFGALYDGERYLVEKYDLRYVTTGRDMLDPPASSAVTTTPVTIVANPTGAFLPDAETEADFLAGFFPDTRVLRGKQATETNVRTVERPFILHMATHGFFGEARNERDNPMFRSGLYLADIEEVEVDRELDDGQLTAYEVSGMDLRGTQLVVLSACETGLGAAVKAEGKELMSEGVSGLRRAFAMAGARTMVMSLWAVSGVTAQTTMEAYYRKLAEGLGPGEAMQAVQLEMLRTKEHAHPKDWAAFIVSGDDTPMVFPAGQEPQVEEPQAPPPVRHPVGCAMVAPSSDRDPSVLAFLLGLLGLGVLRRRRA